MLAAIPLIAVLAVDDVEKHAVDEEAPRRDRFELGLMQASQVNTVSTQHFGLAATGVWHIQQNVGVTMTGLWNFYSAQSNLRYELINRARAEADLSTSTLLIGGVFAGVEVAPFQGKFAFYDSRLVHFSFVINGSVGIGWMRVQLKPSNDCSGSSSLCFPDPTFGAAGARFVGEFGGGFRVQLGNFIALRLELRDLIYGTDVSTINGCNKDDLKAMDATLTAGMPVGRASVSPGCNVASFSGTDALGRSRALDVPLAFGLVKSPPAVALINNLGLYVGATATF